MKTMPFSIKNMPESERPRERLARQGAGALSDAELLAILLGSGMRGKSVLQLSQELLIHMGSLEKLAESSLPELQSIQGLGPAKALQLTALFALARRLSQSSHTNRQEPILCAAQAYALVREQLERETREMFVVLLQDIRRRLICTEIIAVGTLSQVIVHPREVFYPAIRHKAASLILAHNHPSGDPTASPQDRHLTTTLIETGSLLGIPVTDHLIIGHNGFVSLRESGICEWSTGPLPSSKESVPR